MSPSLNGKAASALSDHAAGSDADLKAFAKLVEELRAREPAAIPKGHRFCSDVGGGKAYYDSLAIWQTKPRPDIVAFWALVEELKQRERRAATDTFATRLRARLAEVARLSIADRRQVVGVTDEYLEMALTGARLPSPIAERLVAFVGDAGG